jgi:hypothetical protein
MVHNYYMNIYIPPITNGIFDACRDLNLVNGGRTFSHTALCFILIHFIQQRDIATSSLEASALS